jgi:hypothetical protein
MAVDDTKLHSKREVNVFLQGQLAILDALIKNADGRLPWVLKTFAIELLTQTRTQIFAIYKEHFPESDLK